MFKIISLFLLLSSLSVAAMPKVFSEVADEVYRFIPMCEDLSILQSPIGHSCQIYNRQAKKAMQEAYKLDKKLDAKALVSEAEAKDYSSTIGKLVKKKNVLYKLIRRGYAQALAQRDSSMLSVYYVLRNYNQPNTIDKTIYDLDIQLSGEAQKRQEKYRRKMGLVREKSTTEEPLDQNKHKVIAKRKDNKLRSLTCMDLGGQPAMKGAIGMVKGMVVGRTKQGYILQNRNDVRLFLQKKNLDREYKVLEKVGFHAVGSRIARKISYAYTDSKAFVTRKSEVLPFITYSGSLKKICRN